MLSFTDDGRGLYPETIRARGPQGLNDLVREVAAKENISAGEFIRRAIAARIQRVAVATTSAVRNAQDHEGQAA